MTTSSSSSTSQDFLMYGFGVIGLVFAISAEEMLGYQTFSDQILLGDLRIDSYVVLCFTQALFAASFFLSARHIQELIKGRHVSYLVAILAMLGSCLTLFGLQSRTLFFASILGFVFLAVSCLALKIICLSFVSEISLQWGKRVVFSAVLFQSVCAPLFVLNTSIIWILSGISAVLSIVCIQIARSKMSVLMDRSDHSFQKKFSPSIAVFFGFGILCVGISFLNPLDLYQNISLETFVTLTFITHLVAALLFGLIIFSFKDSSYSLTFKGINSLILIGFTLLALLGSSSFVPRALCTTLFSLFEFITFLAIADLASYSATNHIKLFSGYYFIMRVCSLIGLLLAITDNVLFPLGTSFSLLGVVLFIAVIINSIWLMTENNLNKFFWGNTPQELGAQSPQVDLAPEEDSKNLKTIIDKRVVAIAETYGLSPREQDILTLVAFGRSSTFIAEELYLSSNTVRKHIAHVYTKCSVHSKQELLTLIQQTVI